MTFPYQPSTQQSLSHRTNLRYNLHNSTLIQSEKKIPKDFKGKEIEGKKNLKYLSSHTRRNKLTPYILN